MAERVMVVCDVCGKSPAETVGITATGKSYRKDLCREHLTDLLKGARAPRRGRPASATPRVAVTKTTAASPAAPKVVAKRARKPITDPVLLEKRRAALAKARQARADKRAAAKRAG